VDIGGTVVFHQGFVMGRHHDRGASVIGIAEELENVRALTVIEIPGRLVGEEDGRIVDQGSGNGDPLLLPAGESGRQRAPLVEQAESAQKLTDLAFDQRAFLAFRA